MTPNTSIVLEGQTRSTIQLDLEGARLVPFTEVPSLAAPPTPTGGRLLHCIGEHAGCGGRFMVHYHSASHNAMMCTDCHFRIVIPHSHLPKKFLKDHIGPLAEWFRQRLEQLREMRSKIESVGQGWRWASPSVFDDQ